MFAKYNKWMNERMFEAAATLDAKELARDRGAFFGGILGTLNHIAVGDTVWLHRFAQVRPPSAALAVMKSIPHPTSLRQILAGDLGELLAYRQRLDALIVDWAAELTPEHLASKLTYASMAGAVSSRNLGAVVQHFFNHQTHHRGQASTLLFQAGVDVGVTDLLTLIPNEDAGVTP